MKKRLNSIDLLRGFSVILMIVGHVYYLWPKLTNDLFKEIFLFIVLLSPPIFLLISGMSYYIYMNKNIHIKRSKIQLFLDILKRSAFIFIFTTSIQILFGFTLNLKTSFILYWSIFQVMSFSMVVFQFLPYLKKNFRYFLYFILAFLIFLLNHIIISYEIEFLYILVQSETFPFLSWANFFVIGICIGDLLIESIEKEKNGLALNLNVIGIISLVLWFLWVNHLTFLNLSLFLKALGIFLILFSICYYMLDIKNMNHILLRRIIQWGRVSFSLYYIQFAIIIVGLIIFPLIISNIIITSILELLIFINIAIILILIEIILRIWQKFNYKIGIEWFINLISQKSLFIENIEKDKNLHK